MQSDIEIRGDSPSMLIWCLSDAGSLHHCREKWATSPVHWLSCTLPPPNRTRSSWSEFRETHMITTNSQVMQREREHTFSLKNTRTVICMHPHNTHKQLNPSTGNTHTSNSSLPSFSPHCSAGEPALT